MKSNYYNLRKNVLKELSDAFSDIEKKYKYFNKLNKNGVNVTGGAKWLLDNIYIVEREYKNVKREMPLDYFKGLPSFENDIPRIFTVAKEYINDSKEIEFSELKDYVNGIQESNSNLVFSMGEIWAFPLMLKSALIISMSQYVNNLYEFQNIIINSKDYALHLAQEINENEEYKNDTKEDLKLILKGKNENAEFLIDEHEVENFFVSEFSKVLRDNSISDKDIYNILIEKFNIDCDIYEADMKRNLQEEFLERSISKYITAIRNIDGINWRMFFESVSLVEKILNDDPVNVYCSMDFESKDYYRHKIEEISRITEKSEQEVAQDILKAAQNSLRDNEEKYKCHVGYYLIDDGINTLSSGFYDFNQVISQGTYIAANIAGTLLISALVLFIGSLLGTRYSRFQFIGSLLLIFIPSNEIVVGILNWVVTRFIPIKMVPKMDYSRGVPCDCKTVIIIPAIINSKEKVIELMKKLEVFCCGNRDKNIYFALLSDFYDSKNETEQSDDEIIKTGIKCAEKLNNKYCRENYFKDHHHNSTYDDKFFFLSRKRVYDKKQKVFMGRERKRGKIMEFIELIKGSKETTYNVISSDIKILQDAKYIITLDEDTFLPKDAAFKLIGAMSHVLNVPYIEKDKVVRGYGIIQPKVSISLEAKNATYFSRVFAGENSVDGYSVAYSDTYQDLFREGSFVGKGIINIDEFYERLNNRIKEDRILSHDLLEGALCRCALASDIEVIDGYPSTYQSSCRRLHRWVRGDWQLIGWIFSKKISLLNKWKIFDNLRRSLLAPNLLLAFILSITVMRNNSEITLLCFLALIMSLVFTVTDFVVTPKNKLMGTFKTFEQILLIISFIPYQAFLMMDAIILTLIRLCITRRNLLEWQSSAFVERKCLGNLKSYIRDIWISPIISLLVVYLSLDDSLGVIAYTSIVAVLWFLSPFIAYAISRSVPNKNINLQYEDKMYLRSLTRRIYAYYEDFINKENNFLPPDNYQESPYKGVAYRTSPTNIGMGIAAQISAYDMGYITISEFIDETEKILDNLQSLERIHGHFLNWYDTRSKAPLWPKYVSTVDSGNLLASLWVLKRTMEEVRDNPVIRSKEIMSIKDIYKIIENEDNNIKIRFSSNFTLGQYASVLEEIITKVKKNYEDYLKEKDDSDEMIYWINKLINEAERKKNNFEEMFKGLNHLYSAEFLEGVPTLPELYDRCENYESDYGDDFKCSLTHKAEKIKRYLNKIDKIINIVDKITEEMDFNFLYDADRGLFYIGYNESEKSYGNTYYDLLASESRIASFVAIAKNDVPKEHWFKLSRAMTNAFHTHALVSWSGTMFEYFMPSLLMKSYPHSLLKKTYSDVLKAQMSFAKQKKIPWGISESAFYEFDTDENYQYKAFGIPGLGLKRGLEDEIVVSPYSTLMTLPFSNLKGIKNLRNLEKCNIIGKYGFIEAIDYTKAREDKVIFKRNVCTYAQNVDNYRKIVDNSTNIVEKHCKNYDEKCKSYNVNNVDNVDNLDEDEKNSCIIDVDSDGEKENNPQINNRKDKKISEKSYPQEICNLYEDGIKPRKISTYMVHHLGMSIMALENILLNNKLIDRFHDIPEIKSCELLLKERIPSHVTYERNEEYYIKNKYFKMEPLVPRVYKGIKCDNPQVLLLGDSNYSIMINNFGSGYSKNDDMMLYRWKGITTNDNSGFLVYIKNLNSNDYWSAAYEPCRGKAEDYKVTFNLDKAVFSRKDGNIETKMEIVPSIDEKFEIRKLTLKNLCDQGRSLELTSYMEAVLTTLSADAVHPAFSNLFVTTEYDADEKILTASKRARVKGGRVPYLFQTCVIDGSEEGEITYETSRINFIGRNRNLKNPAAMDNDKALQNTIGTVLDPIISMRARVRVEAHEQAIIYFLTGTSDSKSAVLELCQKYKEAADIEKLFEKYSIKTQIELKSLELNSKIANMFETLASYIFYMHTGRKSRESYIKNISKYQENLWPFGISGDLPIIFLSIDDENSTNLVSIMIKFHYYMKLKGVKSDLVIYNSEEVSYENRLQQGIVNVINSSQEGGSFNKPAGIYVLNKSNINEDLKDFLIGISRIYVDSKNGTLLDQVKKSESIIKDNKLEEEIINGQNEHEEYEKFKNDEKDGGSIEEHQKENEIIDLEDVKNHNLSEKNSAVNLEKTKGKDSYYKQYDHDVDFIDKNDIIAGIKFTEGNKKKVKEDYAYEFSEENLDFFNGYGGFDKNDNSYVIRLADNKNTPAPWINVMSNESFGCHISESGSSYTWCENSRENKITPWSNDYITDPLGEALYIRDDEINKSFSVTPKPIRDEGEYIIKHDFGYSEFIHEAYDIKADLKVFIPRNEKVKVQKVTLENLSTKDRDISVFYYAKLVLGVYEYESSRYVSTEIDNDLNCILGRNPYSKYFGSMYAYLTILNGEGLSFTGDNKEFVGIAGDLSHPSAIDNKKLSNRYGSIYEPCLAVCSKIHLKSKEKKEIIVLLGEDEKSNIKQLLSRYKDTQNVESEFEKVKDYWRNFLGSIQVKTKDKALNYMLNGWLLYQTLSCRYLSRTAFYQSGGAYGFRDQLQDSMSLGIVKPEITKNQILRSAERQYVEGDVQHWWHPVINSGIRTRFSDDLLWLPYVCAEYISSTGDYEILDEKSSYLEDEPLREGEDERYTIVNSSSKEGTIYEHCLKAIDKALKFGVHNIPLMGSGDWNDGMSTVGNKGKGESVWLAWFLYSILDKFIDIAKHRGDSETSERLLKKKDFIKVNIEKNAWDGGWYRRAYFDDGTVLGGRENPECQIDSIAQSWSVISGEKTERTVEAMEAVERNLIKEDKGMILLLAPPFDNSNLEPGYIKGYVPGVRENGGQYTHAAVWVILALTKLNLKDKALKYYDMINPINHTKTEMECMKYKLEPYVMAADVYIKEPHGGRGGWSWYTGAAGWMYKVGIENILGLKKVAGKGYTINPCVPQSWNEFELFIKNETEDYNIKVNLVNSNSSKSKISSSIEKSSVSIIVNGKEAGENMIPANIGKAEITVTIYR